MKWKGQKQSENVVRQANDPARAAKSSMENARVTSSINRAVAQRGGPSQLIARGNSYYDTEVARQRTPMPVEPIKGKSAGGPTTRVARNSRPTVPHNDKDYIAYRVNEGRADSAKKFTQSEIKASEHRRRNTEAGTKLYQANPTTGVQKRAQERERAMGKVKPMTLPKGKI